jgi:hypothetical protein
VKLRLTISADDLGAADCQYDLPPGSAVPRKGDLITVPGIRAGARVVQVEWTFPPEGQDGEPVVHVIAQ